jgi:hypothetical protein
MLGTLLYSISFFFFLMVLVSSSPNAAYTCRRRAANLQRHMLTLLGYGLTLTLALGRENIGVPC